MKFTPRRLLATVTATTLLAAPLLAVSPADAADDVTLNLIGINDFHGRIDSATVQWAGTVETLRAQEPAGNSLLISAGDNVSASLFASAVQQDNPTIDVLNAVGLDASAVGNHEFDAGYDDLINRIIPRADFSILGANVRKADSSRALDAYDIFEVAGLKVAVIGAVTQETPALVSPAGIQGLTFGDPTTAINEAVAELDALPVTERPDVMVASFHEGAPDGAQTFPEAMASSVVFNKMVNDTSPEIDAIFMGHTHQKYAYDAPVPGSPGKTRPIIQTGSYGENVGQIKLAVDPDTGEVTSYTKQNVARIATADGPLVTQFPDLAEVKQIRDDAVAHANSVGNVKKGEITADISRAFVNGATEDRASESTLGNLVADALRSKVGAEPAGADLGIVNPGGLRTDLKYAGVPGDAVNTDGVATYGELNSVLPFANNLNSVNVTGATLKKILEQQWQRDAQGNVPSRAYLQLGVSKNVSYTFDDTLPEGSRITSIRINGDEVDPAAHYKVATFSFLAAGGDNFRAFKEGVTTDTGLVDRDGWIEYFESQSPISPDFARRTIKATGVQNSYEIGDPVSITLPKLDLTSTGSPANTTVAASLKSGDATTDLGSFPVTAGSATVSFDLPAGVVGHATLEVEASPTGTTASIPLTIDKADSTTSATAPAKAKTGTTFTVETTVASDSGTTPTGSVTVKDGATELATGELVDGAASVPVDASKLSADDHTLTVSYSGDALHEPSSTSTEPIEIVKGGSGFGAVVATTAYGTSPVVQLTADEEASGLVYVTAGGELVGMGFLTDGTGTIKLGRTAFKPGEHELRVFYGGDEKFDPTSTTAALTITKGATKTSKSSVTSKVVRNKTKATVKVTVAGTGFTVTSGAVRIYRGSTLYGSATVKNGRATVKLKKFTSSGTKTMTVKYAGNTVALPSSSSFVIKVVKK